MNKISYFLISFVFLSAPLYATPADDGLFSRLQAKLQRIHLQHGQEPAAQWKKFLLRQRLTPTLLQLRNSQTEFVQNRLKNTRNLEQIVPVSKRTAFLLRLAYGREDFPPQTTEQQQADLLQRAAQSQHYVQKQLLDRYNRLQKCITQHPQLASYTLNPEADLLFSRVRFYNSYGTVTAYQTAEKMFCQMNFDASLLSRRAQVRQEQSVLTLRFPPVQKEHPTLEAELNENTHLISLRFISGR